MQQLILFVALLLAVANGFSPAGGFLRAAPPALSMKFDLDRVVNKISSERLLTKTAQLGLLSKLDKAGVKLSSVAPLLIQTEKLNVLGILEVSADKVLPLVALAVDQAPGLLPLVGLLLKAGPAGLAVAGAGSATVAAGVLFLVPDDSIVSVAVQTLAVIPLGAIVPGACAVGATILSKLK